MKRTEKQLQKQCEEYLYLRGAEWLHCTTYIKRKVGDRFYNFAIPGMTDFPDLVIFFYGQTIFVELKVGYGRLSEGQKKLQSNILKHGFPYYVVRSFGHFKEVMEEYGI